MRKIVLVFTLLFLLVGCSREKRSDVISQGQWKALNFLSYETSYLMYINLDDLRKNNFRSNYLPGALNNPENESILADIEKKTGIGKGKGISEVFISSSQNQNNLIIAYIADGKGKLESYFNDKTKFLKQNNSTYISKEKPSASFYFPDDSTLIIFNNSEYRNRVLSGNYKSVKENEGFLNVLQKISIKKSYWMIGNDQEYVKYFLTKVLGHKMEEAGRLLNNISSITVAAKTSSDPEIEINLKCIEAKNAAALSTAIKTALVMDLFSKNNYELNRILKKTEVEREGNIITLNLMLSNKDIDQLKEITSNKTGNNYRN